jgi:hypothetical protein
MSAPGTETVNCNCRNASRLLSVSQERELRADERKALQHHLARCLLCSNFEAQLSFLRKAAKIFGEGR